MRTLTLGDFSNAEMSLAVEEYVQQSILGALSEFHRYRHLQHVIEVSVVQTSGESGPYGARRAACFCQRMPPSNGSIAVAQRGSKPGRHDSARKYVTANVAQVKIPNNDFVQSHAPNWTRPYAVVLENVALKSLKVLDMVNQSNFFLYS
jgi:hypothetical protein